ncbi:MAG: PLP-dependent transferase [Lachnospiraceae bacterium]|nr:PLP-dependent transferase [Lachnospiraceae bacterium]
MQFNTAVLHAGKEGIEKHGATLPPVYQSSAFQQSSAEGLEKIFENKVPGYCYTRVGNPTVTAFENRITKLEGGIASVACASGMAAISNAFLNILQSGDEIVTSASLYGGTIDLFHDLEAFGIHTVFVENNNWKAFENAIHEHTRLIFAETIGNPGLDVTDIKGLSELAHAHDLPLIIDNTTATSYLIRPLELGADIVVNSSSKYINGNSSAISGILTDGGRYRWKKEKYPVLSDYLKYGPMAYIARMRAAVFRNMGACLAPQNAFLNLVGIETLGLRMERQCQNALGLASWIQENYPEVKVNFPGLRSSPWHEIAKRQLKYGYGAIFTMRVGSKEKAFALMNHLKLAMKVSNIGDTKTLVIHPSSTISLHSTARQKEEAGVYEDLIRVSVGIEDIRDLIEDFRQAMEKTKAFDTQST